MNEKFRLLRKEQQELPAYRARKQIIQHIQRLGTAIIIGETGSGKTTQVPQVKCFFIFCFFLVLNFSV